MGVYKIQLTLISDTTFSRGDGVAGLLDREVEHDQNGLPYLHGRTLKGLLGEEVDNLLYCLKMMGGEITALEQARNGLFGTGGSVTVASGDMHFGHAQLPEALRKTVLESMKDPSRRLTRQDMLGSLTAVRRQTSVNGDGLPHEGSLRSMRVILRKTVFFADLSGRDLTKEELALLAASILALRRAGTGRNRGRGQLKADLLDESGSSILQQHYQAFTKIVPEV